MPEPDEFVADSVAREIAYARAKSRCEECDAPGLRSNWDFRVHRVSESLVVVLCLPCFRKRNPETLVETRRQQEHRLRKKRSGRKPKRKKGRKMSAADWRRIRELREMDEEFRRKLIVEP